MCICCISNLTFALTHTSVKYWCLSTPWFWYSLASFLHTQSDSFSIYRTVSQNQTSKAKQEISFLTCSWFFFLVLNSLPIILQRNRDIFSFSSFLLDHLISSNTCTNSDHPYCCHFWYCLSASHLNFPYQYMFGHWIICAHFCLVNACNNWQLGIVVDVNGYPRLGLGLIHAFIISTDSYVQLSYCAWETPTIEATHDFWLLESFRWLFCDDFRAMWEEDCDINVAFMVEHSTASHSLHLDQLLVFVICCRLQKRNLQKEACLMMHEMW